MHPIFIDSERLKCSTYPVSSVAHIGDYFLVNENFIKTRKWFPLQGERAHSLHFWSFRQKVIERRGDRTELSIYPRSSTDYKYTI